MLQLPVRHVRDCYATDNLTSAFHGFFCDHHLQWMGELRYLLNAAKLHGQLEEEIRLRQVEAMSEIHCQGSPRLHH